MVLSFIFWNNKKGYVIWFLKFEILWWYIFNIVLLIGYNVYLCILFNFLIDKFVVIGIFRNDKKNVLMWICIFK